MSEGSDCPTGKVQWATAAIAKEEAHHARVRGQWSVRSYHCMQCGLWHLGNKRRADKRRSMA